MIRKVMLLLCLPLALMLVSCGQPEPTASAAQSDAYMETPVQVGGGKNKLDGLLTLPNGTEKPPVVVLVQGSGPSDKDESIGKNKPFGDLAHGLAEQGVASLRYDKRTYAYPDEFAQPGAVTIENETLDDASAAVELMQNDVRVDGVYVLGHSLGGMVTPKIAQDNPDVEGIVLMAGSPRGLEDIIYDQNVDAVSKAVASSEQKEEALLQVREMVDAVKALKAGDDTELFSLPTEYWLSLNAVDGAQIAQDIDTPMLILQGDADFQVSVENDYNAWQEVLKDKENVVFKLYPNLNHLFMESNGKKDTTEYDIPSQVSADVIAEIAAFVNK